MDLSELVPKERVVEILHPVTSEPVGVRITLVSLDDEKLVKIKRKITDERLRLEARGKNFKSEDLEENSNMLLNTAIVDWEWYGETTFEKEKPKYNLVNMKKVFTKLAWMRTQIEQAIGDEAAFF